MKAETEIKAEDFLKNKTVSYWDSHQFDNALTEEGEYMDIDDVKEYAKLYHQEQIKNNVDLASVTKRWLFWFESEGKDGWTFTIKAKNSDEAYDLAYEEYGPQVEGMMYQEI